MSKERLLITGGTGLLGLNWAVAMRDTLDVILLVHKHQCKIKGVNTITASLENESEFLKLVQNVQPDKIVHTAGMAGVDECEAYPDVAEVVNVKLAKTVASVTEQTDVQMIHISTDHLFSGNQKNYTEESLTSPLNIYAKTKLQAEEIVAKVNPEALIIRTNFFGWGSPHRKSFSDWLLENLRKGNPFRAFQDVFFTPILIDRLVKASHKLLSHRIKGVINVVGDERISKFDFAMHVAHIFKLPQDLILPGSINDVVLKAPRPLDMSLSNTKARSTLGCRLGSINELLYDLQHQELAGHHTELIEAFQ
jgi:dTDP-4-dehydrorhamnose reductase